MSRRIGVPGMCVAALLVCTSGGVAEAGGEAAIGAVSTLELRTPGENGKLEHFGSGVGASILYLMCSCDDGNVGFEAGTSFVIGDSGQRLYDLGISMIASFPMEASNPRRR